MRRFTVAAIIVTVLASLACSRKQEVCFFKDNSTIFLNTNTRHMNTDIHFTSEHSYIYNKLKKTHARAAEKSNAYSDSYIIGLALSGGGIRSNAFQLGVLNGLRIRKSEELGTAEYDSTALDNISYISSVSGGTWAASSYYVYRSQNASVKSEKEFFDRINTAAIDNRRSIICSRNEVQNSIECNKEDISSRILNNSYESVATGIGKVFSRWYTGFTGREEWRKLLLENHLLGRDLMITDVLSENDKPFWIVNTTHDATFSWNMPYNFPFEITPHGVATIADCGNTNYCAMNVHDYGGFAKKFDPLNKSYATPALSVSQVMAMSGAVFPERILGFKLDFMEWDYAVAKPSTWDDPAPNSLEALERKRPPLSPMPFLNQSPESALDKKSDPVAASNISIEHAPKCPGVTVRDFYTLADGGHSENYGALPLIERKVDMLIISDAGYDPSYSFGDYRVLQSHSEKLLNAGINIYSNSSACSGDIAHCYRQALMSYNSDKNNVVPQELSAPLFRGVYCENSTSNNCNKSSSVGRTVLYVRPPHDLSDFKRYLLELHNTLTSRSSGTVRISWLKERLESLAKRINRAAAKCANSDSVGYQNCLQDHGLDMYIELYAETKAKLIQLQDAKAKADRVGRVMSGPLATLSYLNLNRIDFPRDKTFSLAYERDLIYAYYLLGTYIGEMHLTPAILSELALWQGSR